MPNAIITGASKGIGKAVAELLLAQGFDLFVCARGEENLQACRQEWSKMFPQCAVQVFAADLSIKAHAASFAKFVQERCASIDILVNNTGVFEPGSIANEPEGRLEAMMATNLYSAYHLTRFLLPLMKVAGKGHIFNMCSVASLKAYPIGGAYGITKYALLGFSDNLREELKGDNIKVTAICPGATYTPSWEGSGVAEERMMEASDVAKSLWGAYNLSARACVETIVLKPIMGDL